MYQKMTIIKNHKKFTSIKKVPHFLRNSVKKEGEVVKGGVIVLPRPLCFQKGLRCEVGHVMYHLLCDGCVMCNLSCDGRAASRKIQSRANC